MSEETLGSIQTLAGCLAEVAATLKTALPRIKSSVLLNTIKEGEQAAEYMKQMAELAREELDRRGVSIQDVKA